MRFVCMLQPIACSSVARVPDRWLGGVGAVSARSLPRSSSMSLTARRPFLGVVANGDVVIVWHGNLDSQVLVLNFKKSVYDGSEPDPQVLRLRLLCRDSMYEVEMLDSGAGRRWKKLAKRWCFPLLLACTNYKQPKTQKMTLQRIQTDTYMTSVFESST